MNKEQWIAAAKLVLPQEVHSHDVAWQQARQLCDAAHELMKPLDEFMTCPKTGYPIPKAADSLLSRLDFGELWAFRAICEEHGHQGMGEYIDMYVHYRWWEAKTEEAVTKHKKRSAPKRGKTKPLTAQDVKQIRELYAADVSKTEIARRTKRDRKTVGKYVD